jgi:glycosyltransferase involved in cell wall biosynthesis
VMGVILHVTEAFGGGVFASVTQTCNGLAKLGFNVHLAYSERPETPRQLREHLDPRVTLHRLQMTRNMNPIRDLRSLVDVVRLLRRLRPDVVHLHSSKAGFLGRVAAFPLGIQGRVFYSPRGLAFLRQDTSPIMRRWFRVFERVGARLGGTVVACSASELEQVQARIRPRRATVVENAVDTAAVRPRRARADATCRIGTLGRIGPQKDPAAFAALAEELAGPGVSFTWIGGGDSEAGVTLERAGVTVTGWVARERALEHLAELDVYVQTSRWEGMPLAVIEAQVAGLPAVVTDVAGNRDVVVDGATGFVIDSRPEMAERILQLVADPEMRRRMGAEARRQALARFSVDRMIRELVAAYGLSREPDIPRPAAASQEAWPRYVPAHGRQVAKAPPTVAVAIEPPVSDRPATARQPSQSR